VAREAGVATGALYYHFAGFDDFLAAMVLDRFRVQAERMVGFPRRAGSRTVAAPVLTGLTECAP
jgi:AcrR family transcriptional regulator